MSFETLKAEVQALPAEARQKLLAYLVTLQDAGQAGYAAKLAEKIDDSSPDRWLSAEQCEQRLSLLHDSQ